MAPPPKSGQGRALQAFGLTPDQIMPLSLERLRARSAVELPPEPTATVMLRIAYAAGDPDLLGDIVAAAESVHAVVGALAQRPAVVICDVAMVAAGIRTAAARAGAVVLCAQDEPSTHPSVQPAQLTAATRDALAHSTRTSRGLIALADRWRNSVVIIGNAPTALLALLDAVADGVPAPAALIATPCGMVAAGEAKQLLLDAEPCPAITVRGTRGGSAIAAAAFNACATFVAAAVSPP